MSDDARLQELERALRAVPPPDVVPPYLAGVARAEALAEEPSHRGGGLRRARGLLGALIAAGLAACAIAVALVVSNEEPGVARTLQLDGNGGAWGVVEIGEAQDGARQITVRVEDLPPLRDGYWYSLHYKSDGEDRDSATFNVNTKGEAEIQTAYAADSSWEDCWVLRHGPDGDQRVLWVEGDSA